MTRAPTMTCLTSRSRTRRVLVAAACALVPRPPTGRRAVLLLAAARRVHGIADWVAWRAEDLILNLDDPAVTRVSSYDRDAPRPVPGSLWVWRPATAHAADLIMVTSVQWNGEEWWVGTSPPQHATLLPVLRRDTWNDLSVFWEACHAVAAKPGPAGRRDAVRRGPPAAHEIPPAP